MTSAEYREATTKGRPAHARVSGILRGGFVVGDLFYTMAGLHPMAVPLGQVSELSTHP